MRHMVIALMGIGALGVAASQASGQWGWGGPFAQNHHSSTAAEGLQRGAADVIRSAGMANVMNSEAAKNYEDARTKYLDNRLKGTKTYFEMRRYNKEYREAEKGPRPTSEQLFRLAKQATPKSLAPNELDPVTGEIAWPIALQGEDFAPYRKSLEELYAQRASAGGKLTPDQFNEIQKNIDDLQIELGRKARAKEIQPQTFTQANAFVKRLGYESRRSS